MDRRHFLLTSAATGAVAALPAQAAPPATRLVAAEGEAGLVVPDGPATRAWLYNGTSPGPLLRGKQGETLVVEVENQLPEPTTVHWHGLRVPVGMDGVPYFSQEPIPPGGRFAYELPLKDAGTFWYHPHVNSSEQVGRGLNGLFIVDEPDGAADGLGADRELAWAIDDWRVDQQAQLLPFGRFHDATHGGRIGNVLTVNGTYLTFTDVRAGERLRLRLANVANALAFRLRFEPFRAWVVALDGHPIAPKTLADGLWLGAGQRADLVVDVVGEPGTTARVIDDAYGPDEAYEIMTWRIADAPPLRTEPRDPPQRLPANPVARPDLAAAQHHELAFTGGAMGGMREAMMGGRMLPIRELVQAGKVWAINGTVPAELYASPPMLSLQLGRTYVLDLVNRTRWPHPIHLHGHSFHVLGEGADPLAGAAIRDTVLLQPETAAKIAFVADNPGKWMLHCHILEHQGAGMMGVVAVA